MPIIAEQEANGRTWLGQTTSLLGGCLVIRSLAIMSTNMLSLESPPSRLKILKIADWYIACESGDLTQLLC